MKEGVDIGVRDFYQKMVDNKGVFPKSSLPSVQDYMEVFEPIIKQGKGIVCICITSKFSGSVQSATNAKNILLETYPDAKIEVMIRWLILFCRDYLYLKLQKCAKLACRWRLV